MDIIDIALSKKYTDESLKGIAGTLAGKNCTIKSTTKTDGVTTVVFAWTADDGTEKTTTIQVNDGVDGKDTSQEAVLFIEQKLDDTQRTQARENIGAADAARQNILMGSEIGNPIVVDDAFSAPLSGLTLYGKSTQVSTTGAQLFDVSNADVVQMYIAHSGIGNFIENYSVVIPIKPSTSYTISEKNKKIFRVAITEEYPIESAPTLFKEVVDAYKNITTPNNLPNGNFLMIQLYGNFNHAPDFSGLMLNEGSTTKPYEPYTGGKPSPSPEYPQEIKSVGDKGHVDISALGANLAFSNKSEGYKVPVAYLYGLQKFYIKVKRLSGTSQVNCRFYYENGTDGDDTDILTKGESKNEVVKAVNAKYPVNHITIYTVGVSDDNSGTELEYLMVSPEDIPYEPYKPAQTLIIPTPNGLPGVPTIDNGNYTDASGQQWLCDEVDLKRGVYVQNVAFAEFGKEITVLKKNNAVSNENFVAAYFFTSPSKRIKTRQTILSNCLSYVESINKVNKPYSISNEFDTEAMYVTIPTELYENDVQMLNLLAEKKSRYYMQLTQLRDLYPPKNLKNTGRCEPTAQQRP